MWIGLVILILLSVLLVGYFLGEKVSRRRILTARRSPAEFDLEFEEIAFQTEDKLTLRGWWIPAPGAQRTVILLHGHGGSMDPDVQYAPAFHSAGFNVLMFDFRAHGRSDGNFGTVGWLERLDVLAAVSFAQQRGSQKIGLLGFSMGARAAVLAAPFCPAIDAVISDDGPARLTTALRVAAGEQGSPGWLAGPLAWLVVAVSSLRARTNLFRCELPDWIGKIAPRPVLIIHGLRDPYLPADDFAELVCAAGNTAQVWTADAWHREVDTLDPDLYRRRVIEFFNSYMPGG